MSELDEQYLLLLQCGLPALRNAALAGDLEHCRIESEHLHEIPSLTGESNLQRHLFYMNTSRRVYLKWAATMDRENVSALIEHFYTPAWNRMAQILETQNR